jgi:hypothetical protein
MDANQSHGSIERISTLKEETDPGTSLYVLSILNLKSKIKNKEGEKKPLFCEIDIHDNMFFDLYISTTTCQIYLINSFQIHVTVTTCI